MKASLLLVTLLVGASATSTAVERATAWLRAHRDPNSDALAKIQAADPGAYDVVQKLLKQKSAGLLKVANSEPSMVYGTTEEAEFDGKRAAQNMEGTGITSRGRNFFGWKPTDVDNDMVMSVVQKRQPEVTMRDSLADSDDTATSSQDTESLDFSTEQQAAIKRGSLLSSQATVESGEEASASAAAEHSTARGLAEASSQKGMYDADAEHFTSAQRLLSSDAAKDMMVDSKAPNPYAVKLDWDVPQKKSALADFNTRVSKSYLHTFSWNSFAASNSPDDEKPAPNRYAKFLQ